MISRSNVLQDSILFLDTLIDEIAGLPAPQEIGHSTPAKKSELPTPPSVLRLPPLQLHHIAPVPLQSAAPTPEEEAPPPLPPKVHPSPLSHPVPATQHPPPPPKELPPKLPPHAKELPAVPNIHVSPRECIPPPLPPPRETPPPVPPRSHKSHLQLQQQQHSRVSPRPNDSASETTDKITTKHLPTKSASEYITLNTKDTPTSTKQQPTKSASESTITLGAKENEGKPSRSEFMIVSPPRTLRRTDSEFLSNSRVRRKAQPAPLSDMYPHLLSCWGSVSTLTSVRPDYVGSFTKEQLQEVQKRQQRESVRYSKLSIKGATTTADVVESLREDLHRINSDKLALQGKLGFRFPTKYRHACITQ